MTYLYHNVAKTVTGDGIAGDTGTDGLPVKPDTADAVYQDVVLDDDIDCSVKLDAAYLGSAKLDIGIYIVDVIVLDYGEYSAQMANNAGLAAVVDMVVTDDVRTYVVFVPSHIVGLEDRLQLTVEANELALSYPAVLA